MSTIHFTAKLTEINSWIILRLPAKASDQLPSRGQVMVEGTINGFHFQSALEPDGKASHWLKVDDKLLKGARAKLGDTVTVEMQPSAEWPEPKVPADLQKALAEAPKIQPIWKDITPMARWDWIRWIGGTANPDTRKRHIEVALSKLGHGERRPCCFNRGMCMEPSVSKNGVLIDPIS